MWGPDNYLNRRPPSFENRCSLAARRLRKRFPPGHRLSSVSLLAFYSLATLALVIPTVGATRGSFKLAYKACSRWWNLVDPSFFNTSFNHAGSSNNADMRNFTNRMKYTYRKVRNEEGTTKDKDKDTHRAATWQRSRGMKRRPPTRPFR